MVSNFTMVYVRVIPNINQAWSRGPLRIPIHDMHVSIHSSKNMISKRVESFLCFHDKNTSHMEVISINAKLPCKLFWATVIKNTLHIHLYKSKSWKNMSIPQKSKCFQCGCLRGTVIIKQPESKRNAEISEPVWLPTAVQTVQWRKQIDLGHVLRVPDNQVLQQALFQHEEERRDGDPEEHEETQ